LKHKAQCGLCKATCPEKVITLIPQRPWPADKVERWSIDRLIPYAKNARTHTDAQVAAIAASIKEWGWTTPPRLPRGDVGQVRVVVPSDRPVRVGATMHLRPRYDHVVWMDPASGVAIGREEVRKLGFEAAGN